MTIQKILDIEENYSETPINRLNHKFVSLETLKNFIFNELHHPLKDTAKNTVFSNGSKKNDVMIIGEAPGAEEDEQGLPFVGRSGQLLTNMLKAIHLERDDVYITNLVPWRPPGNRNPTTEEMNFFLPYLKEHIRLLNPRCIMLLGSISARALLGNDTKITQARGKWHQLKIDKKSYDVLPTFHPSYLLRSPGQKKLAWEDLQILEKYLNNNET